MLMPDDRRESRILGLSICFDHCMSKPVDLDELGMVLRNLQRRQRAKPTTPAATPEPANAANIDVADWQFDPKRRSLSFAQGQIGRDTVRTPAPNAQPVCR